MRREENPTMTQRTHSIRLLSLSAALAVLVTVPGLSLGQAEKSLDSCEKTAAKNATAQIKARTKTIAKCLQKISGELVKNGKLTPDAVAKACAGAFRKLNNTVDPTKTIQSKAKTKIRAACDPTANAGLAHSAAQVLSLTPPVVAEGIEGKRAEAYCQAFGGDGTFDLVEDWVDCQLQSGICEANQQITVEYPRVLEWLDAIRPAIVALGSDPKYTDGLAALDAFRLAIDSNTDDTLDINCGPGTSECGNGTVDANEECDGVNLNGQTCVSVGFPDGGTLACKGNCGFNYQGCSSGTMSKTGQTTVYQADDDGDIQAGPNFNFVDNPDGTISDLNTGLMWEKMSDDNSVHDRNNPYSWSTAFSDKINKLNNRCNNDETVDCTVGGDAACGGVGGECGFAGYRDWRLPNIKELQSILDLGTTSPSLRAEFNYGCTLNCTVLTCSCGPPTQTWSSTTYNAATGQAWFINFLHGRTDPNPKTLLQAVRAVRTGN